MQDVKEKYVMSFCFAPPARPSVTKMPDLGSQKPLSLGFRGVKIGISIGVYMRMI